MALDMAIECGKEQRNSARIHVGRRPGGDRAWCLPPAPTSTGRRRQSLSRMEVGNE
jgi:hypothetical protein